MIQHGPEQFFSRSIPQHVAAEYFYRVKHAGWGDPPDETGQLEGQFAAPLEQVLAALTEVATAKMSLVLAYHVFAESMRGVAQHACAEVFHEHAEHERAAAEAYLKRAAVLGGGPIHLTEIEPPPASADPAGILQLLARAEQEAIAAQNALRQMVGEDNPLRFQIEQFMVEDQHHLDELWQMLPQDAHLEPGLDAAAGGAPAPGGLPPEAGLPGTPPGPELGAPPAPPAPPGPPGPGAAPSEEGLPEEEDPLAAAPPPPAEAGPPAPPDASKPKPKEDKPKEDSEPKPEAKAKEAFARALRKLAGLPEDINAAMSDEDRAIQDKINKMPQEQKSQEAKKAVGPLRDLKKDPLPTPAKPPRFSPLGEYDMAHKIHDGTATPSEIRDFTAHLREQGRLPGQNNKKPSMDLLDAGFKPTNKLVGYGALGGAALGALSGAAMSDSDERRLRKGGPIARFTADHPSLMGAAQGGSSVALGLVGARHGWAPALAGSMAPRVALGVTDKVLKAHENRNARAAAKMASARFGLGLLKLALAPQEPGFGSDPAAAPMPDNQPAIAPQPSMAAPGPQPPMATPPGQSQYAPVNYLEAEETARRAQEQNEANFYRSKAEEAGLQAQSMGAQVQQIQTQLDQLTQQAAEANSQIMAANQEAVTANDQMLNQATLAARMRMGMQQLRAQMMEVASQDPEQLAAAAGGPTPMDVGNQAAMAQGGPAPLGGPDPMAAGGAPPGDPAMAGGDPMAAGGDPGAQPGTPGASPDPATQPQSPSGGAGGPSGSGPSNESKSDSESSAGKKDSGETTVSIKKGSVQKLANIVTETLQGLPYGAAGGALGAAAGYHQASQGKAIPTLRDRVDALKGEQDGGFGKSLELARAQVALGEAEEARANPGRAALKGGLTGASLGMGLRAAVPAAYGEGKQLIKNLGTALS